MVYWGCGTTKNRCMWALFTASAVAGGLLLIAGGAKLDICSKLPLKVHISAGACSAGPVAMMVVGAFVLLGTIPSVLFFSGCARGPPKTKYSEGVPASGITVVRRTADGPQIFHYDSAGRLIAAPDCQKHAVKSSQYVLKGVKAAPALPGSCASNCSSPSGTPRHPLLSGFRTSRMFSSESGEPATAEVYVSAYVPTAVPVEHQYADAAVIHHHHQQQEQQQQEQQHIGRASPQLMQSAQQQQQQAATGRDSPQQLGPLTAARMAVMQQQQEHRRLQHDRSFAEQQQPHDQGR